METTEALYTAATSTFESLAFAFAAPVHDEEAAAAPVWAGAAHVVFEGPWDGELTVRMDVSALSAVAANMLGTGAPGADLQRDALGELANVICGNVLSLLAGSTPIFSLAPPRLDDGAGSRRPGGARVFLELEGGYAEVLLHGTGLPAQAAR